MKRLSLIILLFVSAATAMQAQTEQEKKVALDAYRMAETAYEKGEYRTAIAKLNEAEQLLHSSNMRISWLKAMSYYNAKEYQKCLDAAEKFFGFNPPRNEAYAELTTAYNNSKQVLQRQAEAEQKRLADEKAEQQRKTELARQKAAYEKEAAEKWETLKNSEDIAALQAFINKYGDTPSETPARKRYDDESAWQKAKNANSLSSYENYLNGSTLKNHAQETKDILERNYVTFCKNYAAEGKIENMEDMYKRYVTLFPNGRYKQEMQNAMCDSYLAKGSALTKSKNTKEIEQGLNLLKKTEKYKCSNSAEIAKKIQKGNRKYRYYRQSNVNLFFIGYSGDIKTPIGITLGGLHSKYPMIYASVRLSPASFKKATEYIPDKLKERPNYLDHWNDNYYVNWRSTGVVKISQSQFIVGLTYKVYYPLYIYAGGGVNTIINKYEYKEYYNDKFDKNVYYKRKDRDEIGGKKRVFGVFDTGIMLRYKWFYLNGGVRTNFKKDDTFVTFGAGFAF